jgi:hypothetical protein
MFLDDIESSATCRIIIPNSGDVLYDALKSFHVFDSYPWDQAPHPFCDYSEASLLFGGHLPGNVGTR